MVVDKLSQPNMATSSGMYGKMFCHTILREKIFSIILFFLLCNFQILEIKMSDYRNHLRFSLRCLDRGLIPVSLRLKNLLRTQRGKDIIYKTEKRLLNERIKNINMTLKHYEQEAYMYQHDLKQQIEQNWWEECKLEINKVREIRHNKVLERQRNKFIKLLEEKEKEKQRERQTYSDHISYNNCTKTVESTKPNTKWVINLSNTPLTEDQESLLKIS